MVQEGYTKGESGEREVIKLLDTEDRGLGQLFGFAQAMVDKAFT